MRLVAISGWKGSGKDMLASHLIEKFGAVRVAFADPLKDRVAEEYGIDRASLDDQARKEQALLQYPVKALDGFSANIVNFMLKEFRTADGKIPIAMNPGDFSVICSGDDVETDNWRPCYWTPRALAIFKGSGNRAVISSYWVSQAVKKIKESDAKLIVMSDVRFRSEVSQLREAFGKSLITMRVNRFDTCTSSDPSERDLDGHRMDYLIENRGTKESALASLECALKIGEFGAEANLHPLFV